MAWKNRKIIDHAANVGKTFNRLTVVAIAKCSRYYRYICTCACGKAFTGYSASILKGHTKSCGCAQNEYYNSTRSTIRKDLKQGENAVTVSKVLNYYTKNALVRGYEFELSRAEFYSLIISDCYYCGAQPSRVSKVNGRKNPPLLYNGIDRVDNTIGYNIFNCVPCCTTCNKAKSALTFEKFENWITGLVNFRTNKGKANESAS